MISQETVKYKMRLDHLFGIGATEPDIEKKSHWARYLCVLVSGYIAVAVREIFIQYTDKCTSPNVASYVRAKLRRSVNPNMKIIIGLANSFSRDWGQSIETQITEKQKDAIDSINAIRNLIAHGSDTGITYIGIKGYYEDAIKVIVLVKNICDK